MTSFAGRKGRALFLAILCGPAFLGSFPGAGCRKSGHRQVMVFAGAASKPAMEECARVFSRKTGIDVQLNLGGSGTLLSQLRLTHAGDVYVPASDDYMTTASKLGLVDGSLMVKIAYLVPAIVVARGNPRRIMRLEDLARKGLRVAIGDPRTVAIGKMAAEILVRAGLASRVRANLATTAASVAHLASLVALGSVDAAIGWRVLGRWNPEKIEVVPIHPDKLVRVGHIPAAATRFARDRAAAKEFVRFLVSPACKAVYKKNGYLSTEEEMRRLAPTSLVGGEFPLPRGF